MANIKKELKIYLNENLSKSNLSRNNFFAKLKSLYSDVFCEEEIFEDNDCSYKSNEISNTDNSDINNFINNHAKYNDFQTLLFKFIDDRHLKDSDVYNKVHIDRRLFSKIRSNKNYHPSKETVILLAIALELSEKELDELLESASYSLPKNNKYDLIIRFCFINKIFKLMDVNELLHEYNCKLFNY